MHVVEEEWEQILYYVVCATSVIGDVQDLEICVECKTICLKCVRKDDCGKGNGGGGSDGRVVVGVC